MVFAAEFGTGQVFWSILWLTLFFIWIWLLIDVFGDIFRSKDLSGWGKALWTLFVIVLPYLGVLVYLIARGHKISEHRQEDLQAQQDYIRSVAGGATSEADQLAKAAELHDEGVVDDAEFARMKAKILGT